MRSSINQTRIGPQAPDMVCAVIENPLASTERIIYDADLGDFRATGEQFPTPIPLHYGWIPETHSESDHEELDVMVITDSSCKPGRIFIVRPIGVMLRDDGDHKVLAVARDRHQYRHLTSYKELPKELLRQAEEWFRANHKVTGWLDADGAHEMITKAHEAYVKQHNNHPAPV